MGDDFFNARNSTVEPISTGQMALRDYVLLKGNLLMRRRDFCMLAASGVAGALTIPWNGLDAQVGQPHAERHADPLSVADGGALPKVRVRAGWRGLVTGENEPFIPIGAMYFRASNIWTPQWVTPAFPMR